MTRIEQEVVIITDGTGKLGRVACEFLQERGYMVYGTSPEALPQVERSYQLLPLNISSTQSVNNLIQQILAESGKIDVLINNAGYSHSGSLIDIPLDDMIKQYNVNVFGAMRMIQGVVPYMLEQGGGRIINVGSIGGRLSIPFQAAYSSSKAALMNISDSLKIELLNQGIKVCLIEPGESPAETTNSKQKIPPQLIARVIYKAMLSRNPKPRYTVGPEASLVDKVNRLLPSFLRRKLIMNMFKIPESRDG